MHYNNTWTLKKKKSKKSNTWNQKTFFVRLIVTVALIQLAYVLLVFQSSTAFFLTPAPSMNELRKTIITYIHGHVGKKICIHKKNVCIKLLHVTVSMCSSQCTDHSVWDEMLCIWRPRSHHGSDVLVAARTWIYWMYQCPSEGAFLFKWNSYFYLGIGLSMRSSRASRKNRESLARKYFVREYLQLVLEASDRKNGTFIVATPPRQRRLHASLKTCHVPVWRQV